jgi:hypothetical protein
MRSDPQALGVLLTGEALRGTQENMLIAVLRRPTLGSSMKEARLSERHFPRDLRAAFNIAMTNSQAEIRRLVAVRDPRIWPLYGKRIIEWNESQARAAARQLVNVAAFPASVRLDVEGPDDVAPLLRFVGDEFPERGRCH